MEEGRHDVKYENAHTGGVGGVGSGQWAVGSGQWAVQGMGQPPTGVSSRKERAAGTAEQSRSVPWAHASGRKDPDRGAQQAMKARAEQLDRKVLGTTATEREGGKVHCTRETNLERHTRKEQHSDQSWLPKRLAPSILAIYRHHWPGHYSKRKKAAGPGCRAEGSTGGGINSTAVSRDAFSRDAVSHDAECWQVHLEEL
ncbi:hypothetical protein F503_07472 [Ophiostoma piceae UAMH 11346]|uniref:Uncharacterized protein n=1 Tax=Ophiostoma piceae (strain UAMH 11346) TaxID=1262450 RepID=S3CCK7_OPHP1|nr:hypothetical protein F503_07472 [Ophiostoma piceae UAMH 11346]